MPDAREDRTSSRRALLGGAAAGALVATATRLPLVEPVAAQELSAQANRTYEKSALIEIRDQNDANPYPSIINVRGMPGSIQEVRVHLRGLTHGKVGDVQICLVSPNGISSWVMGSAGGTTAVQGLNIEVFDDAPNTFDPATLTSGSYKPDNVISPANNSVFPPPAPDPVVNEAFAVFNGLAGGDLNGPWRLYVFDDERLGAGVIAGGWRLQLTTTNSAPTARNDQYTVRPGEILTVRRPGLLRNDRDRDDDRLRVVPFSRNSRQGRITVKRNGSFRFETDENARGTARFDYTVEDRRGGEDSAKIIIRVRERRRRR